VNRRRINLITVFVLIITFFQFIIQKAYSQSKTNKQFVGTYYFRSKVVGNTYFKLIIKHDSSFKYKSDSHMSGKYIDYGTWSFKNDTLVLKTLVREENKKRRELNPYVVRKYQYKPNNELCWKLSVDEKSVARCFAKKKNIFCKPDFEKIHLPR